jgi:peptidase C25-like protein/VCBS repeat protein/flagellar hook capping protein FlgD
MLLSVNRHLWLPCILALALVSTARAGVTLTRTVRVDPDHLPATEPFEIPAGERLAGVDAISLECAEDGARAVAGVSVRVGYQGFERGRHLAWLELPDGCGLPLEHARHAMQLRVLLHLEPSAAGPVPRERVVPEWEPRGGPPRARAAESRMPANAADGSGAQADAGPIGSPPLRSPPLRSPPLSSPPRPGAPAPFLATQVPSLLGSPVAYLIVTSDALVPEFQRLADWKTASGVPAAVRTLSFIREQYPTAVDDPERVRMFIRDAYSRWGTRWVLLGGDTEILPARIAHVEFLDDQFVPTDLYYSCLDGNWNADGDSTFADAFAGSWDPGDDADLLPEVWVGRAPVVTPSDAERFVSKTLTYETTPAADYMENVLFFAQVITPDHWSPGQPVQLDGAQIVELDEMPILDSVPNMHVGRLYQNHTDPHWRPGAVHESRAAVYDSLQLGYNLVMHVGHGYREVMSCGDDNLGNADMHALTNGDRLMNFYAIDCTSNAVDYASIGEALMRAPAGGAVTNIGSTRLDYPKFSRGFQREYFRLLFQDSVTAVGEAQARQKLPFVGASQSDTFNRLSQLELLLLGDPELRIFTARPRELTVVAPDTLTAGEGELSIEVSAAGTPLPGAQVTAWMPGHEYRTALTDGSGGVTLPFHPDSVGPCSLTVTAFNARPWRRSLVVVPGAPAALQAAATTVLDDALAGRSGDGDGLPDAGEQVDLVVAVRNAGGAGATGVIGTLSTVDPWVTITNPSANYGAIDPGATSSPGSGFRIGIASDCPDQHEVAFTLDLAGDGGLLEEQRLRLLVRAAELVQVAHVESEEGGNDDGRPQPGETVHYTFRVRNVGTGDAHAVTGRFRNLDGLAVVLDSTLSLPDLPPGAEASATPVRFTATSAEARLVLSIDDASGPRLTQVLDLGYPAAVTALAAVGGAGRMTLDWQHEPAPDLAGYNVYRAIAAAGPFVKVTPLPVGRSSSWADAALQPLTRYFYRVTSVDSSGNESTPSDPISAGTGPAEHGVYPAFTRESSQTPATLAPVTGGGTDILVGGGVLHLFHADGTAPVDADGSNGTPGDFTTLGRDYEGGGSIADLDGDGGRDVIGATWGSKQLLAFDAQGLPRVGFPVPLANPIWSSVAVGDLDGDRHLEMVFASLGTALYAFRSDGGEWRDGDANPATLGVFKTIGGGFNAGTPALAPLAGPGPLTIIYGGVDGFLYAWMPDGSNVPGFPVNLGAPILGSVALGRMDGPAGPLSIVVPVANGSLHVRRADGSSRPGFPVFLPLAGFGQGSSPALADMNGDGFNDIVVASSNGRVYVFDRNGAQVSPWTASSRFSTLTSDATRASPVVADINGDGVNDVVVGDESGSLAALSGASGAMLPGFPIAMAAEASGTAALCDCDGDGMSEIVTVDFGGTLHVWDYDFPFSPAGPAPWPQFHHDARRTGWSEAISVVGVEPELAVAPRTLELAAPHPNPAHGELQFALGVPIEESGAALELAVYDLAGRRIRVIVHGPARAGRSTARWDTRDAGGARMPGGVYLVRLSAGAQTRTRKVVVLP